MNTKYSIIFNKKIVLIISTLFFYACTPKNNLNQEPRISFTGSLFNYIDFENDNIGDWSEKLLANNDSLIISLDPKNELNKVAKFSLNRYDRDVNNSKRAELMWKGEGSIGDGKLYCYGFRNYIPESWEHDPGYEVIAQWKAQHDKEERLLGTKKSPALALRVKENEFFITNLWDERPITPPDNSHAKEVLWKGELTKGVWNQWKICAKWSYQHDGFLTVWKNNEQVIRKVGPNAFNDPKSMKFKLGIYKPPWNPNKGTPVFSSTDKRELYYDDIWMGILP